MKIGLAGIVAAVGIAAFGGVCRVSTDICVTDFGAKGDGVTDDTAAIQRAACEMAKRTGNCYSQWRHGQTRGFERTAPRMVFPQGKYLLSGPVIFRGKAYLVADGGAEIVQTKQDADCFFVTDAYICRFEGFTFRGGQNQVKMNTYNNEAANLRITNCRFIGANGAGIYSENFRTLDPNFKRLDKNGRRNRPKMTAEWRWNEETNLPEADPNWNGPKASFNNSTMFIAEHSVFDDCAKAIYFPLGDGLLVRHCKIMSRRDEPGAAAIIGGALRMDDVEVLVRRNPKLEQWAFECNGLGIWAANIRMRTDDGSGAPLWNYTRDKCGIYTSRLAFSDVRTDTGAAGGVVRIANGFLPHIVAFCNVKDVGEKPVKAIFVNGELTQEMLDADKLNRCMDADESHLVIWGKNTNVLRPDGLIGQLVKDSDYQPMRQLFPIKPMPKREGKVFNAEECGVDTDPKTDDTESFKKFLALLKANPGSRGVLPAVEYTVSETLMLDGDYTLEGAGIAMLGGHEADDGIGYFRVKDGARAVIRNLQMKGGAMQFSVAKGGIVWIDNCYMYDPWGTMLKAERGGEIIMEGGIALASFFYEGEGDVSIVENYEHWLRIGPRVTPFMAAATFVNRGRLQTFGFLGVPTVLNRVLKDDVWNKKKYQPQEFRWVDNFGEYYSLGTRYGGEWGGHTPVYHYGKAKTRIEGGIASYQSALSFCTPLIANSPDPDAIFFGVGNTGRVRHCMPERTKVLWRETPFDPLKPSPNTEAIIGCSVPRP